MSEQQRQWSGQSVAGRYRLGNYLGGTEHSAVFATEIIHARTQRVAIKLIPASGIVIARQLSRWKALSAVSHPNLLKILDYGKCDLYGAPYLYVVMEYADEDLADILPQRALNGEETRGMMEPVIETLAFLHEQNLVHTRIHPGNILATGDQINTDPMLGPLQDNGGPTFTHALLPGSPAIDAGDPSFTPPPDFDQRGPG